MKDLDRPASAAPHVEYTSTVKLAVADDFQDELNAIPVERLAGELVDGVLVSPVRDVAIVEEEGVFPCVAGIELAADRVVKPLDRRFRGSLRCPRAIHITHEVLGQ